MQSIACPRDSGLRNVEAEALPLIGESTVMSRISDLIDRVARTDATVLITGESGTGKELVARALHQRSARCDEPFVAVNCGAIPSTLIEAELFGYEKGSFTGAVRSHSGLVERANGGTLFLDEITEMPLEMQTPLLRFIETRRFFRVGGSREIATDVRVIAATNRNPARAVAERCLREDLYYRLAVFPIDVPPLREREDDVLVLAEHFLEQLNGASGLNKVFSERSLEIAARHAWPGNVRELKHAVERAYILAGEVLELDEALVPDLHQSQRDAASPNTPALQIAVGSRLRDVERTLIEATLEYFSGNKRETADALGCSLKTLYNKLNGYARAPSGI
jgi:DNA-binding NtrC family response regulator